MAKRKPRKQLKNIDLLEPLDLTIIGTDKDPCFGKLYDLSTDECKMCGDNARCAIVFSQKKLLDKRVKEENKSRFKDLEDAKNDEVIKYIKLKKSKGLSRIKVVKLCNKKFGEDSTKYKAIYKKL